MYKRNSSSFIKHLDFLILDLIAIVLAYTIANFVRHGLNPRMYGRLYLTMVLMLSLFHIMISIMLKNYKNVLRRGWISEIKNVFLENLFLFTFSTAFMFIAKIQNTHSRIVLSLFVIFDVLLMLIFRDSWKNYIRNRMVSSDNRSQMLVVTRSNVMAERLIKLKGREFKDFRIVGAVAYDEDLTGTVVENIPVVSSKDTLFDYLRTQVIDEVFIETGEDNSADVSLAEQLLEMGIVVHIFLDFSEFDLPNTSFEQLCGYSIVTSSIQTASNIQLMLKRLMDICAGIVGTAVTGILFLILGPIIYLQSPGPIFFGQERVGRNGRRFKMYKFRSMYPDAEARKKELMEKNEMQGLMFKLEDDPRITPIGKFIRKTSLDEFPQFWNILKGEMSLIGTRPPTVDEFVQYENHHRSRLAFKPGLTGLWQVSGRSDITDFEEVVELDTKYIREWSLKLDIKILLKTIGVVLRHEGSK